LVNLDDDVQVTSGGLLVADKVDAEGDLQASGPITLSGAANLAADVLSTSGDVTFGQAVEADGLVAQLFEGGAGALIANNTITKTGLGDLTLAGETGVTLAGIVAVESPVASGTGGNLFILDDFTACGDLLATGNITFGGSVVNATLDGAAHQLIDAENGTLTATGSVSKVTEGDLTLHGGSDGVAVNLSGPVSTSSGNLWISADNSDIQVGGDLTAGQGGVSVISNNGSIYTNDGSGALNIAVAGWSNDNIDGSGSTGVSLPNGNRAAIVIVSGETLSLGSGATLSADGLYNAAIVDDRAATYFLDSGQYAGDPIDVAIYVASTQGDVHVAAPQVSVAAGGTMVADAYDAVTFGSGFIASLPGGGIGWLEACSRITTSLTEATTQQSLPYADDPDAIEAIIGGSYVLRGNSFIDALVLQEEEVAPPVRPIIEEEAAMTAIPASVDLGEMGQIEGATLANLQWLAEELGLCEGDREGEEGSRCQELTQAYLAGAFLQATDLRPHQAASQLRLLAEVLHDADGTRVAALTRVVSEFVEAVPPSEEQMTSIAATLAEHTNDGTHYAAAGQWLDALAEYVGILNSDIGWTQDESVAFVMGKYCAPIAESGDAGVLAFVQMHLEGLSG
jgi:hypothetical protein